jgi:hypothetical protein
LKERYKEREEEEEANSYWMTLRIREDTGNAEEALERTLRKTPLGEATDMT